MPRPLERHLPVGEMDGERLMLVLKADADRDQHRLAGNKYHTRAPAYSARQGRIGESSFSVRLRNAFSDACNGLLMPLIAEAEKGMFHELLLTCFTFRSRCLVRTSRPRPQLALSTSADSARTFGRGPPLLVQFGLADHVICARP